MREEDRITEREQKRGIPRKRAQARARKSAAPPWTTTPARKGESGFGRTGWDGPSPPAGKAHRYVFRLLALVPISAA
jgi:phosphatidylethanolamine-binding protein (PEBP) family uncharacterized protein